MSTAVGAEFGDNRLEIDCAEEEVSGAGGDAADISSKTGAARSTLKSESMELEEEEDDDVQDDVRLNGESEGAAGYEACGYTSNINDLLSMATMPPSQDSNEGDGAWGSCTLCRSPLLSKRHLCEHMRDNHGVDKPFQCGVCHAKFPYSSSLYNHTRIHSELRPFKCNLCDAAFRWKNSLKHHKRFIHNIEDDSSDVTFASAAKEKYGTTALDQVVCPPYPKISNHSLRRLENFSDRKPVLPKHKRAKTNLTAPRVSIVSPANVDADFYTNHYSNAVGDDPSAASVTSVCNATGGKFDNGAAGGAAKSTVDAVVTSCGSAAVAHKSVNKFGKFVVSQSKPPTLATYNSSTMTSSTTLVFSKSSTSLRCDNDNDNDDERKRLHKKQLVESIVKKLCLKTDDSATTSASFSDASGKNGGEVGAAIVGGVEGSSSSTTISKTADLTTAMTALPPVKCTGNGADLKQQTHGLAASNGKTVAATTVNLQRSTTNLSSTVAPLPNDVSVGGSSRPMTGDHIYGIELGARPSVNLHVGMKDCSKQLQPPTLAVQQKQHTGQRRLQSLDQHSQSLDQHSQSLDQHSQSLDQQPLKQQTLVACVGCHEAFDSARSLRRHVNREGCPQPFKPAGAANVHSGVCNLNRGRRRRGHCRNDNDGPDSTTPPSVHTETVAIGGGTSVDVIDDVINEVINHDDADDIDEAISANSGDFADDGYDVELAPTSVTGHPPSDDKCGCCRQVRQLERRFEVLSRAIERKFEVVEATLSEVYEACATSGMLSSE